MFITYSDKIYADIGFHVFPIKKYRLIHDRLIKEGIAEPGEFIEPPLAIEEDLLLVHTKEYVRDLMELRWTERTSRSELPLGRKIRDSYLIGTSGTIMACAEALKSHIAVNLSGGFHHAFPDHAEGFCYTNDTAVAIRKTQQEGLARKFFVVDCDLHQGNGTAYIFRDDPDVFTFSIHQENNYPIKQKSDLDIGLPDRVGNEIYISHLQTHIPEILDKFKPEMVIYLAGADPYEKDQLGGLSLTIEGLKERDEYIMSESLERGIPVTILLAGGYAYNTDDTVSIHVNTCIAAKKMWSMFNES
ncbi:histone deacetylase [Candidatus Poribacteria bacterium]|nr:histone deacetylase [Candidatus Poribacteria bacterium]